MSEDRHERRESTGREGPPGPGQRRGGRSAPGRDAAGRQRGPARAEGRPVERSATRPAARPRTGDAARRVAFDVLREVAESDAYANLVLPPLLRSRGIAGRDAGFATELTYGTLRWQGRYDAVIALAASRTTDRIDPPVLDVLRLGVHQLLAMRVPAHAAVSESVALARSTTGTGASQFVNAVLRKVSSTSTEEWIDRIAEAAGEDATERAAVVHSHPVWVVRALRQALLADGRPAEELDALLEADNASPAVSLVARPGLADSRTLLSTLTDALPGRWARTAVILDGGDPASVPGVREGSVGVQDEGSQLVALALAAVELESAPGGAPERWLDLCAGPGGKAALLGALAAQQGATVVANELQPHRVRLVERTVAALPDGVVEVRCADGREVGLTDPDVYDRVLVDAPCTGLGALRRRPESRWRRTAADVGPLTQLQRELLGAALDAVRPGGIVAYATCSPHVAETQLVVRDVLKRRADVELLDARDALRLVGGEDLPLGPGPHAQLWPHVHGTDAMHLTMLRKTPGPVPPTRAPGGTDPRTEG
ncbi:RsmB/NOP family class I SAM-dependent RNA methyltransferase [Actinotalea sp. K2]|uniref:RsmB/NOP family class I SAM-dependent RNA methyltransferase n=1 Tax=Actinotalea sp. K2 TaxID=2939438 RepID=UPI002017C50D|nr:transcription antitermination factor NusB [Actinotalea sp. K2]MCL3862814.1 rRNA small subunit methyltransferase B [Actinotalea sp. K2]